MMRRSIIPHPPPISNYQITHKVALRFTVGTAVVSGAITFQNLLDTICVATSAVAPYDLFTFVKVRRLRLWALPLIGGAATVGVVFSGTTTGVVGDQKTHTDTSMGIEPAYLDVAPSNESLASKFQVSSANTAFSVTVPVGAVIDCHLSLWDRRLANL